MSHLKDCVLWSSNPLQVASSVGCVMYTKCPEPRIKRDCLRRTGGKGNVSGYLRNLSELSHFGNAPGCAEACIESCQFILLSASQISLPKRSLSAA